MENKLTKKESEKTPLSSFLLTNGKLSFWEYYTAINNRIPHTNGTYCAVQENFFQAIIKKYKVPASKYTQFKYFNHEKEVSMYNFCIMIQDDIWLVRDGDSSGHFVLYNDTSDEKLVAELLKMIEKYLTPTDVYVENKIFLLYETGNYLYLQDFEVRPNKLEIKTHYNDDFLPIHEKIIKRLNTENDKGLVLLHGEPGTGKTSYIRHLTSLINKKMIYIPSEYADKIASPHFLPLMISNPNSVLIIEDAENIVEAREGGIRNAAVSSLLNVADGLLSDCLNLQIICTFNTHLDNIDKALLRKGRLIANYQFKELETEKAQNLSDKLGFKTKIKEAS
ncbi:MAG: AAA family ATPase, partial [Bacteroidetes bacterium]